MKVEAKLTTGFSRRPPEEHPVALLLLDPENPRLPQSSEARTQEDLLRLISRYDVVELVDSMAKNGYFDEEPLIAVPAEEPGKYVVVEGNRRLAALKLLLDPTLGAGVRIRIPVPDESVRGTLERVPVKVYETRNQVIRYLGVRHIAGVKEWDAYAKARYIQSLTERGYVFSDIAPMVGMGNRTDVVRRWLLAYYIIHQANEWMPTSWDQDDREFDFSRLYTALGYPAIRSRVGLVGPSYSAPEEGPIATEYRDETIDLMEDLYGPPPGDRRAARIPETRDIRDLAAVYSEERAFRAFRDGQSLEDAKALVSTGGSELAAVLAQVLELLRKAETLAPHFTDHLEVRQEAFRCEEAVRNLVRVLQGYGNGV